MGAGPEPQRAAWRSARNLWNASPRVVTRERTAVSRCANFQANRARWGLGRALYVSLMTALRRWLVVSRVYERDVRAGASVDASDDGIEVRIMTPADLEQASRTAPQHFDPAFLAAAKARGDVCAAAFDGDRLVAFVWRSFSTAPHVDGLWVRISKPCFYGYKVFTYPDYRGRRLHNRVSLITDRLCIERGYTHGVGFAETHNFASNVSVLRNDSVPVGYAGYFLLFGRAYPFHSPGARRRGFRFYRL
jgi:hypothetical protein